MSDYERRYNVCANRVSRYTDDPREALRFLDKDPENGWCAEGYADYEDVVRGHPEYGGIEGTLITRRTTGPVSREKLLARIASLEYAEQRAKVQQMIQDLTGGQR